MKRLPISFVGLAVVGALGCSGEVAPSDDENVGISEEQALEAGYARTPFGLIHPSCIHEVSDEASIAEPLAPCAYPRVQRSDVDRSFGNKPPPPATNGWVEASWGGLTTPANYMRAQFKVPAAPRTQSSQLLYFFPSLEPSNGSAIVQPVLQWGTSPAGGGRSWGIASWYVDNAGNAQHSTLRAVSSGDVIDGIMEGTACTSAGVCTWKITATDVNTGASTVLNTRAGSRAYTQAQGGVMEAYGLSSCGQYPGDSGIVFSSIVVRKDTTTLNPAYRQRVFSVSPACGFGVDIGSAQHTLRYAN
ncbi:hypothetical protein [Pendulispora albinea]|uniref:Secreted protein n=1 Tax=Pendulispora albinea TaxID=2741071 RepID=A0ABZ2M4A3_9BACT